MLIYNALKTKNILDKNIDLSVPDVFLKAIAAKTRLSFNDVWDMSLKGYEGYLFERFSLNGQHAICLFDTGEAAKDRPSLQFCPLCLSEPEVYYRKSWRISFITVCTKHHCQLHDRCPECGSAVTPLKNDSQDKRTPYLGLLCRCSNCKLDLRKAPVQEANSSVLVDTSW